MEQYEGFQQFDYDRQLRHFAIKRQAKGIKQISLPETESWMFSTDLDNEIDLLTRKLEANQCH